jgi:hypothetical protein
VRAKWLKRSVRDNPFASWVLIPVLVVAALCLAVKELAEDLLEEME